MSLIEIQNLSFTYDGSYDPVFENCSLRLDTDWKLGFVGRNGRGKTTFLKLLMDEYDYQGSIRSSVSFSYYPGPVAKPDRPALDVIRDHCPLRPDWEIGRECSLLELPEEALSRPFASLSGGEQTKALLISLFLMDGGFPLIDEPTNHLDMDGRAVLGRYLGRKRGFILVSHDRALLDLCTDHTLSINKTGIEIQAGNFSSWQRNKEARDQFEREENRRLEKEIGKLEEAARRSSGWSDKVEKTKYQTRNSGLRPDRGYIGHKAAKMMARAKSMETRRETAAEEKSRLLKDIEQSETLKISPLPAPCRRLAFVEKAAVAYGDRTICVSVDFTVEAGDRIALVGKNGCGKSSVLKLILGQLAPSQGRVVKSDRLVLSYVGQSAEDLRGDLRSYIQEYDIDESLFKAILRKLDFSRALFDRPLETYSQGQKKKVMLARSLCERAHLYIWDEPLNYIDLLSRMQVEELISTHQPTMLLVEHDRAFCQNVANKIVRL